METKDGRFVQGLRNFCGSRLAGSLLVLLIFAVCWMEFLFPRQTMFGLAGLGIRATVALAVYFMWRVWNLLARIEQMLNDHLAALEEIERKVGVVIGGQQLAGVLQIQPWSLKITPEEFAPNREKLKAKVNAEFPAMINRVISTSFSETTITRSPETCAYMILNRLGLDVFLSKDSLKKAQVAISRLVTNEDWEGIKKFLFDIIDYL
ncbi:MAG: hypothetical protein A2946_04260 [Candidatus Liptonbacteria bacterium RIFCSPLOWO2_01_FULL_53_13]|uniref:Uncharacterized protein n=1 Tax=Candidatus Liptonbacteria bacterium RIFCSPLOWO2_01_FULL_53_13 TaxID=1798651 RepID=A0A1G2CL16_9BACT|nr:MAG: hypothetical protein A2946_04260 [Candidatus Liptonbacteria bacterium RIFCSPLOWO2_01_FULL_53_13]